MFDRNRVEIAQPTMPKYSEAEKEQLYQAALGRIEEVEGVEYLDGYKLPPDNEEVWDPRNIHGVLSEIIVGPDEEIYTRTLEHEFKSRLTNSWIRQRNISWISQGNQPMYIRWEDVELKGNNERNQTLGARFSSIVRNLVNKAVG